MRPDGYGARASVWQLSLQGDCSSGSWKQICLDYGTLLMLLRVASHAEPEDRFKVIAPREAHLDEVQALRRRGVDVRYGMATAIAHRADDAEGRSRRGTCEMPR